MTSFKQATMKFTRILSLKFPDPKMEVEYAQLKGRHAKKDFTTTLFFMIVINIMAIIPSISDDNKAQLIISSCSTVVFIVLYCFKKFYNKHLAYLTLIALFCFNLCRLTVISISATFGKIAFYHQGYIFASVQCVVISRIHNTIIKIYAIVISFGIRYGILVGVADPNAWNLLSFFRQMVVDIFVIYMFYSNDKTERRIFRGFFEKRDELAKFKELLDDSLPQSVTVLDYHSKKSLFSNNTFLTTFDQRKGDSSMARTESIALDPHGDEEIVNQKLHFEFLQLDPRTLREAGSLQNEANNPINQIANNLTLDEFLEKLVQEDLLRDKALCVVAYYSHQEKQRTFEITMKKVKWEAIDAIAIILNDTTYQENLVALKVANINKDKLIATVSHELRTPLHGIIGILEMTEGKITSSEILGDLSLCKDNALLLLSLVNSLLDLQQLTSGKLKLNPSRVNVNKVLKNISQLFKFQCTQKNIFVNIQTQDIPTEIITDENRLKQILINLVNNAIKFTFNGGITIEVKQDPEEEKCLLFSVMDTGIGIKEEDINKLFKTYGRLADAESVNRHGVGLGLTISGTLAALLNGKNHERGIEVKSVYGEGSNFYFKILKNLEECKAYKIELNKETTRLSSLRKGLSSQKRLESESTENIQLLHHKDKENNDLKENVNLETEEMNVSFDYCEEKRIPAAIDSYTSIPFKNSLSLRNLGTLTIPKSLTNMASSFETPNKKSDDPKEKDFDSSSKHKNYKEIGSSTKKLEASSSEANITYHKIQQPDNSSVLVVDDNPFNILVAKNLLQDLGYQVKSAFGGHEAIEVVKSLAKEGVAVKVIFMDCQMPVMDGYETTKQLKRMMEAGEVPKIPILAWTANDGEKDIKRCYDCGMTGYLTKPTTKANVIKAIPT